MSAFLFRLAAVVDGEPVSEMSQKGVFTSMGVNCQNAKTFWSVITFLSAGNHIARVGMKYKTTVAGNMTRAYGSGTVRPVWK